LLWKIIILQIVILKKYCKVEFIQFLYTLKKAHFDKNFPENKNIKYTADNKCHVMEDDSWKEKDIGLLSKNLIKDNTEVLLMYCDNNEIKLLSEIKETEKYEHIRNKLFIIYNKTDHEN